MNGYALQPDTVITLRFDAERAYGRGGCNRYSGEYSLGPGQSFSIGEGGWTEIACPEPAGVMEQEAEYFSSVWKVNTYQLEGNRLSLMNRPEGILLQYQRLPKFDVDPRELTGKSWQLVSAPGLLRAEIEAVTLWFNVDTFEGTTACRDYEGSYGVDGDSLFVGGLRMVGDSDCGEKARRAEEVYRLLLSDAWQYNLTESTLVLYTERGEELVFRLMSGPTRTPAPTITPSATPPTTPLGTFPPNPSLTPTRGPSYP
jgi:heat shock protein HslJ